MRRETAFALIAALILCAYHRGHTGVGISREVQRIATMFPEV